MSSILISLIAWWIATGSGIVQDVKNWLMVKRIWYVTDQFGYIKPRRVKPFDCEVCMGFWLGFFYNLDSGITAIIYGIVCSALTVILTKVLNRL